MPHPQKYSKVIPRALIATPESIQSTATAVLPEEAKLSESKPKQVVEDDEGGPIGQSIFKDLSRCRRQLLERVHKEAVTSVHVIADLTSSDGAQKVISTSMDGFIKMLDARDGTVKKAFFVCQSGINSSTSLSSQDSFALAAQNHNIYVFSFLTGTTITNFYAHDDIINKVLFSNVTLSPLQR